MTLFKPKQITCPKDTWVRIISNFGRGFPQTFKVSFKTADGSMVSGTYKENRYAWIFPRPPVEGTLSPTMSFRRFWINGIYSADVRTDQEATAYVDGGIGKLVVSCLIFFLLLASLTYAMFGFLKRSDAYQLALSSTQQNSQSINVLGSPINAGWWVSGSFDMAGPSGTAEFSFPVEGSKARGTIYASSVKSLGEWHLTGLVLEVNESRIKLK